MISTQLSPFFRFCVVMILCIRCVVHIVLEIGYFTNRTTLQIWHKDKKKYVLKENLFTIDYIERDEPNRRVTDKFSVYCPCQLDTQTSITKTKQIKAKQKSVWFDDEKTTPTCVCLLVVCTGCAFYSVFFLLNICIRVFIFEWIWIVNDG